MRGGMGGFLAGMAQGYGTVMNFKRQADEDEWRREERERMRKDREEADALKAGLKAAGTPVTVEPGEVYQPAMDDEGNAMPANPTAATFAVRGVRFDTRDKADAAAAAQNSPAAVAARQAGVLGSFGKVSEAMQLRSAAQQQELAGLQTEEARAQANARKFYRAAAEAALQGGWDGVARFATENYNDGRTYKPVTNDKGGARLVAYAQDGKELGGMDFASPADFLSFTYARSDPSKYVERADRQEREKREQANSDRTYGLNVAQLEVQARNAERQHQLALANYRLSASREARDPFTKMPESRKLEHQTNAARIKDISAAITKAQAEGSWNPKSENARALQTDLATLQAKNELLLDGGKQPHDPFGILGDGQPTTGQQFIGRIAREEMQRNGVSMDDAVSYAVKVEQRIQQEAGGNPVRAAQLRAELLQKAAGQTQGAGTRGPGLADAAPARGYPPTRSLGGNGPTANRAPSYEGWLAAKEAHDDALDAAQNMSPDRREAYLRDRLPALKQELDFQQGYLNARW